MNIFRSADPVAHHAIRQPHAPAIAAGMREISYASLDGIVDAAAHALHVSARRGARVAIFVADPLKHWVTILALQRLGAVSVSVATAQVDALEALSPDLVVADRPLVTAFPKLQLDKGWLADLESGDRSPVRTAHEPGELVRIVLSSGTTGRPKMIPVDHAALVTRVKAGIYAGLGRQPQRMLSLAGADTFWGFALVMRTWWAGATVCFLSIGNNPAELQRIDGIAASPRQVDSMLRSLPPDFNAPADLSVVIGGGRVSPTLARRTRVQLASQGMGIYGSTEAGGVAVAPLDALAADDALTGFVLPWCDVQAVDDAGRVLPAGETGHLRMRTPELIGGYLDDPEGTARHFRDGWFHPGDAGSISATGALRVLARTDDLFNLGGVKVAAGDLDEAVQAVVGVADAAVVQAVIAGHETLIAAVVAGGAVNTEAVRAAIIRRLGAGQFVVRVATVPAIPRTSLGKVRRDTLRETLRDMARRRSTSGQGAPALAG